MAGAPDQYQQPRQPAWLHTTGQEHTLMAIRTQESLSDFIAFDPQLRETLKGDVRFYARISK